MTGLALVFRLEGACITAVTLRRYNWVVFLVVTHLIGFYMFFLGLSSLLFSFLTVVVVV